MEQRTWFVVFMSAKYVDVQLYREFANYKLYVFAKFILSSNYYESAIPCVNQRMALYNIEVKLIALLRRSAVRLYPY